MQFTDEGDGSTWRLFGHSGITFTSAPGGIPNLTPININFRRQDTSELWVRDGQQNQNPAQNVSLGAPLEHLCGKAGNPGYMSYAWELPAGTRLVPIVAHQAAVTPTGRSPLFITAHAMLRRPDLGDGGGPKTQIGSKNKQQMTYRGHWTTFTGRLVYGTGAPGQPAPLGVNVSDTLLLNINTTQYFFIDSLWCRASVPGSPSPVDPLNALVQEAELYCTLKDTVNQSPFTVPGPVPIWSIFGNVAARYYHPPSLFVVRPRGSLEIVISNGPTAPWTVPLEFTVGGVLVDKPDDAIVRQLQGA
jgi:hypothetical protein